ncbi:MAG TPA: hypothetical protein VGN26_08655 [Armatimonadota bacterium]|jgi:hypothetical protein
MGVLSHSVVEQYERAFWLLERVVQAFNEEEWLADDGACEPPVRQALHAVEGMDFYLGVKPHGFQWGKRLGGEEDAEPPKPTQEELLTYASEVLEKARGSLSSATDEAMRALNTFPWSGAVVLDRHFYNLRHAHAHIGELNMLLRLKGKAITDWR